MTIRRAVLAGVPLTSSRDSSISMSCSDRQRTGAHARPPFPRMSEGDNGRQQGSVCQLRAAQTNPEGYGAPLLSKPAPATKIQLRMRQDDKPEPNIRRASIAVCICYLWKIVPPPTPHTHHQLQSYVGSSIDVRIEAIKREQHSP